MNNPPAFFRASEKNNKRMPPFLLCVLGPLQGGQIPLRDQEIVIGRDRDTGIYVGDLLLSRRHCSISNEGSGYKIRDLESLNGVFVNETKVHEHELQHGDKIEIGTSLFYFLTQADSRVTDSTPIQDSVLAKSTTTYRLEESIAGIESRDRGNRNLSALVSINNSLSNLTDLKTFSEKLLDFISEAVPCERAFLIEAQPGSPVVSYSRLKDTELAERGISKSICEQVLFKKMALLASDVGEENSLLRQSVLCVPLLWIGQLGTMIYLDAPSSSGGFTEAHLQVVSAIAALTSPLFCHLQQSEKLQQKNSELEKELLGERRLVGESTAFKKAMTLISKVAPSDSTVLILGESGTGKELAARRIYAASNRADGPFVAINCAAIPEALLESELFGHEKGAFTGALAQRKGKIESAEGGVIFLDEIGELSPALQAKLLRVLQEREVERVGGSRPIPVDIRILAATNQNLEKNVQEGKFRQDLFYRLNVISVKMPALREMEEDILLIAQYFVEHLGKKLRRSVRGITLETKTYLRNYSWPGNIRELENTIERAIVLGVSEWILPEDLPENILESGVIGTSQNANGDLGFQDEILKRKRELVLKAFEESLGSHNEAASKLGVHPNYLYRLVQNLKLQHTIDLLRIRREQAGTDQSK